MIITKKRALVLWAAFVCICFCSLAPLTAAAAEDKKAERPAVAPQAESAPRKGADPVATPAGTPGNAAAENASKADESFDIVLLMDSSGSMRKTDPRNYRLAAARLFISLLGNDDRVGVVSFGDAAKVLLPLTRTDTAHRNLLFGAVGRISSTESTTHIHEAVRQGYAVLSASPKKNRVMLLLSDGKLTLGSREKEGAALSELSDRLGELSKSGMRLYSIAFTERSDMKLLEDMAKATGGFSRLAAEDKDIHVIFSSVFEKMKSPDTVPIEGDTFAIDKDIDEAIVVITKKQGTSTALVDPSGKKNTPVRFSQNMQWYEAKLFDMITIAKPATGKWKVNLSTKEGNRIFVITDLKLKSSFDRNYVNRGDRLKISAWLEKEERLLAEADILGQVAFSVEVVPPADAPATAENPAGQGARLPLQDAGGSGDEKAGDGVYSGEILIDRAGEYTLKVIAEGKTFKREKVFQFKAAEPPPAPAAPAPAAPEPGKTPAGHDSWEPVLIKFGIVNAIVLLVAAAFYFGGRARAARKTKQKRGKRI